MLRPTCYRSSPIGCTPYLKRRAILLRPACLLLCLLWLGVPGCEEKQTVLTDAELTRIAVDWAEDHGVFEDGRLDFPIPPDPWLIRHGNVCGAHFAQDFPPDVIGDFSLCVFIDCTTGEVLGVFGRDTDRLGLRDFSMPVVEIEQWFEAEYERRQQIWE
ncbi:hypothetical protein OT109_13480 [Phycisphaeraceae bacterium D3-23]